MKHLDKFTDFSINESDEYRRSTELEKEVFLYLNELRDSGVTNMYGAVPYILDEIESADLDKREASKLLSLWMSNFNEEGNYDNIKE